MERVIKYYLLYEKKTNRLYAYSGDKKEMKRFLKFRNTSRFIKTSDEFNLEDRKHISAHHSQKRIKSYRFSIQGVMVEIPLTYDEINVINQCIISDDTILTALSTIDPNIFKKKIFTDLFNIQYCRYWMRWRHGVDVVENDTEEATAFKKFMNQYSELMNLDAIKKEAIKKLEI